MAESFVTHRVGDDAAPYKHWRLRSDAERFANASAHARDCDRVDIYQLVTDDAREGIAQVKDGNAIQIRSIFPKLSSEEALQIDGENLVQAIRSGDVKTLIKIVEPGNAHRS